MRFCSKSLNNSVKKHIFFIFLSWRLLITIGMLSGLLLSWQKRFFGAGEDHYKNIYLWSWANFDGFHYLSIAYNGYHLFQQAFFPLYPILISISTFLSATEGIYSGLIISHLSFLLFLLLFVKLLKIDYKENNIYWILLLFIFFPTSFYLGSVYTESLFLFLSVASFYFARKGRWFLASLFAAFASGTRLIGIFLLPFLVVEYFWQKYETEVSVKKNKTTLFQCLKLTLWKVKKDVYWIVLSPLGLILYTIWLKFVYNDFLYFQHALPAFGSNKSGNSFILLPQVFFRYLKIILFSNFNYQYVIAVIELLVTMVFLILSIIAFRKIRFSYALFSLLSFVAPTLTGSLSSMPRYVLTIFPLFIVLNILLKFKWLKIIVLFFFVILLIIATGLFTRGYWIS